MFLTISLPNGVPRELTMPHYFLQELNAPIFFWGIRVLITFAILGSIIACIYFEKKALREKIEEEVQEEKEDE